MVAKELSTEEKRERKAEYQRTYRQNKKNFNSSLVEFAKNLGTDAKEIVLKMIEASMSNPILGITTAVIMVDVLEHLGIIRPSTAVGLYVAIGAIEGATVADATIESFTSVFHLFGKSPNTDLIQPSATTLVMGDQTTKDMLTGISESIKGKVK